MNRIGSAVDFLLWRRGSGSTVEIYDIQVGSARREGVGSRMVDELLHSLPPGTKLVFAITRASNRVAQEFYEANGFRIVGNLFDFYMDEGATGRVDAVMYGRAV